MRAITIGLTFWATLCMYVLHVFASSLDNLRTDLSQNLVNGKMKVN